MVEFLRLEGKGRGDDHRAFPLAKKGKKGGEGENSQLRALPPSI